MFFFLNKFFFVRKYFEQIKMERHEINTIYSIVKSQDTYDIVDTHIDVCGMHPP